MLYCSLCDIKLYFAATNEPLNFITQTAQGQVTSQVVSWNVAARQNFLFQSLHISKSNRCHNKKFGDSKAGYPQRVLQPKHALSAESIIYIESVFCFCKPEKHRAESSTSHTIRQRQCHKAFAVFVKAFKATSRCLFCTSHDNEGNCINHMQLFLDAIISQSFHWYINDLHNYKHLI